MIPGVPWITMGMSWTSWCSGNRTRPLRRSSSASYSRGDSVQYGHGKNGVAVGALPTTVQELLLPYQEFRL